MIIHLIILLILFSFNLHSSTGNDGDSFIEPDLYNNTGDGGENIPKDPIELVEEPMVSFSKPKYDPPDDLFAFYESFKSQFNMNQITWNNQTNLPYKILLNYESEVLINSSTDLEILSKNFILDLRELLGFDSDQLVFFCDDNCINDIDHRNNRLKATYHQYYFDVPVVGSYLSVWITPSGRFSRYQSLFYPDIDIDTNPTISSNLSLVIVSDYCKTDDSVCVGLTNNLPELVILPRYNYINNGYSYDLCWKVQGKENIFFVDSHMSQISRIDSLVDFAVVEFNRELNGEGGLLDFKSVIILVLCFVCICFVVIKWKNKK